MDYRRFAVEELPAFRARVLLLEREHRIAVALRLDRLRRGQIGDYQALGRGVFELRMEPWAPLYVHRRAARVTALCLGAAPREALLLAAVNEAAARHPVFDAVLYLPVVQDVAHFLELALAGGEQIDVIETLDVVAQACGASLRSLTPKAELSALLRRICALGLRIRIEVAKPGE